MPTLNCPSCGARLTVSPAAPRRLTCPRCLAHVENPSAGQPPPLPMQVIPLDDQVQRDSSIGNAGVIMIGVMVGVGLIFLFSAAFTQTNRSGGVLILVGLMLAATMICVGLLTWKPKATPPPVQRPAPPVSASDSAFLEYLRPGSTQPQVLGMAYLGQAIGGIILGIVVAVLLTISLQNSELVIGGVIAPAAVGVALLFIPGGRGLGLGLILAVPVAFLLLIGLCFAAIAGASFH